MKYLKLYENFEGPDPVKYPATLSNSEIYDYISSLDPDMYDTDIHDRVYKFNYFVLKELNLDQIDVEEFAYNDQTVDEYVTKLDEGNTYPPIVFDSEYHQIIDGTHRCQALLKKGAKTVWAYVGEDLDEDYVPGYGDEDE